MDYVADGAAYVGGVAGASARISRAEAGQIVNLARRLDRMPGTASAVAYGVLSRA